MASRTAITAGIVCALVILGLFGAVQPAQSQSESAQNQGNTTVSVGGTASVTAPPDRAIVRASVVRTAPTAEAALDQLAANVSSVRDALRNTSVPSDQVRTTSFSVTPVFESTDDGEHLVGFRAAQSFEIGTEVDRAGPVVDVVVDAGANQVDGVEFTLDDDTRRALRSQALELAVGDARADATAVATASDLSITSVERITVQDVSHQPFEVRFTSDGGTEIDPGPVRVSVSVSVTYRAE